MDLGEILNRALSLGKKCLGLTPKKHITLGITSRNKKFLLYIKSFALDCTPKENITFSITGDEQRSACGKGQMFMIAAIFMIIGFVLMKSLLSLPAITEEKTFQDISQINRNLNNIKNEYAYVAGTASLQGDINRSGGEYLFNLSVFIRREFDARILYVYIASNGTTRNFSATIGNFMKNNVSGRLNATSSTPTGRTFVLNDTKNVTLEFNASAAWINVTLNYTIQNTDVAENFYFNSSTRNYVVAFFDINLRDSGFSVRSKSTYNRTWPSWQAFT